MQTGFQRLDVIKDVNNITHNFQNIDYMLNDDSLDILA